MPVLRTDVALTGHRIAGQHVVAVDHSEPGEDSVVEADQADHPVWYRPHRHHRAHRQRAGAEVRARGPAGEVTVQQRLDVGQPHQSVGVRTGFREHVVELTLDLAGLPQVGIGHRGQRRNAGGQRAEPFTQWPCAGERFDTGVQALDVFGQSAGEFDAVTADVVERECGVQPRMRVVGHRHARQYPVDAETPSVLEEVDAVGVPVGPVETPADVRLADPVGDGVEVVVAEVEAGAYGTGLGEIEDLAGGGTTTGECEQLRCHTEQRIGLRQCAIGEFDAKLVCRMRAVDDIAEAKARDDQRRIGLDVRTHDEDVAWLEGVVVGEQAEQHFAQDVDLARRGRGSCAPAPSGRRPTACGPAGERHWR